MKEIEREHPEYVQRKAMLKKYRDLYAGGEQLRANATEYLIPRDKEPTPVYNERLQRVFYENYVGSIIDWYAATLFRREPILGFEGPEVGRRFFCNFTEDCDFKGTSLSDFFRERLTDALVGGSSFVLVDFPRRKGAVANRAEEDAAGLSRAFLTEYRAEDLTNWSRDELGEYEWVVLRTFGYRKESLDGEWRRETRWLYLDRKNYRWYQRDDEGGRGEIAVVDEGPHATAKQNRVPLFELRVSDGLWLMNKSALLQLEHFNKSNALAWGITMSLFAMPVIFSGDDVKPPTGESYYLRLGKEDRFGWTETEGKVYQIASDNLARLREEIYRVCYLLTQAGGALSGNPASGLSKQRDYSVTQEVLRAYGDAVKDVIKKVLQAVNAAREDGLTLDVSGLDEFDIGDFSGELADAERLLRLGEGSMTLRREVLKKLALKYLCDTRQEVKDRIARELSDWVSVSGGDGGGGSGRE